MSWTWYQHSTCVRQKRKTCFFSVIIRDRNNHTIYSNLTGQFPVQSYKGMEYMFVATTQGITILSCNTWFRKTLTIVCSQAIWSGMQNGIQESWNWGRNQVQGQPRTNRQQMHKHRHLDSAPKETTSTYNTTSPTHVSNHVTYITTQDQVCSNSSLLSLVPSVRACTRPLNIQLKPSKSKQ